MKFLKYTFMTLAMLLIASPVFAADGDSSKGMLYLGAGLGMAIAAGLCGLAQGKATASAAEALARNPGARPGIFLFLLIGCAFIESLVLFTFVMIYLKLV
jgi:F-type H+-transporting ATPase subunit c